MKWQQPRFRLDMKKFPIACARRCQLAVLYSPGMWGHFSILEMVWKKEKLSGHLWAWIRDRQWAQVRSSPGCLCHRSSDPPMAPSYLCPAGRPKSSLGGPGSLGIRVLHPIPPVLPGAAALLYFRVTALVSQGLCPHVTVCLYTQCAQYRAGISRRWALDPQGAQQGGGADSGLGMKTDRGLALDPTTAPGCPTSPHPMQLQSAPVGVVAQCGPDAAEDCPGTLTLSGPLLSGGSHVCEVALPVSWGCRGCGDRGPQRLLRWLQCTKPEGLVSAVGTEGTRAWGGGTELSQRPGTANYVGYAHSCTNVSFPASLVHIVWLPKSPC